MRAAIYARRSTDEHQTASLDVQASEARRYIEAKGWTIDSSHVYLEDAVSRAEFKKRPAMIALLNAAETKAFDVVVTRDETRLGGDVNRTGLLIQSILESGLALHYYFTSEEVTLDSALDKFMIAARNFASELEREKISQRTREHLQVKARRGFNTGGRVFGYDNVRGDDAVDFRVNEREAAIVRDIFRRFAAGQGYAGIARTLNDDHVPSPRAGKRGTGSWSHSCVRSILRNARYIGVITWGEFRKGYRGGTKVREKQDKTSIITVERLELRIIDPELWTAVEGRLHDQARSVTSPSKEGPKYRYLLSGIGVCAECGGPMQVESSKWGTVRVKVYSCAYARKRGRAVCTNTLRRPIDGIDGAVADWIRDNVLREEVVIEVLRVVRERLAERTSTAGHDLGRLEAEAKKVAGEIDHLVDAIVAMGHSAALATKLAEREAVLGKLKARIEATQAAPGAIDLETRRLEKVACERLAELRSLLGRHPAEARQAIETLIDGRLTFEAVRDETGPRYRITGKVSSGALCTNWNVPTGIRTPVAGVKSRSPGPLDDGDSSSRQCPDAAEG